MKRNWELVREILLALENKKSSLDYLEPEQIESYDPEAVSYHIQILDEAGLIEGHCTQAMGSPLYCYAKRLTWIGHEFLDEIRSETVWNRTKSLLKERGIALSFEAISMAVKSVISAMLV